MRKTRTPLIIAIAIGLLASSTVGVTGQDEATPVEFTGATGQDKAAPVEFTGATGFGGHGGGP